MKKFDFKKVYKELYSPKTPAVITLPALTYVYLQGQGNPNGNLFQESIMALYAFSYAVSMSYKNDCNIPGFYNFVVPPFEGHWDIISGDGYYGNKDNLKWKIRMPLPEFVSEEVFNNFKEIAYNKRQIQRINDLKTEKTIEKKCCVYMHIGPYDNETSSFILMEKFIADTEYKRCNKTHTEIYISDLRKTAPEKLKTVLLFDVELK